MWSVVETTNGIERVIVAGIYKGNAEFILDFLEHHSEKWQTFAVRNTGPFA